MPKFTAMDKRLLCAGCNAQCCHAKARPFAVGLTTVDIARLPEVGKVMVWHKGSNFSEALWVIPYIHGKCPYLNGDVCSVYERRPMMCRKFHCTQGYPGRISFFLEDHPAVLKRIRKLLLGKEK